ncbi:MAG: NosD domain-containing protein [Candidatus Bipolaricaulota bacterium]
MKSGFPLAKRIWAAALSSVLVGAAFLASWALTRDRLPMGTILVPRDAETVAAALERVETGGTIALDAAHGPFSGPLTLDVEGVRLISHNGRALVEGAGGPGILLLAHGTSVDGVSVRTASVGVTVTGSNCVVRDVDVQRCVQGIDLTGGHDNRVVGVRVVGGRLGLAVTSARHELRDLFLSDLDEAGVHVVDASEISIENANVVECRVGLSIERSTDVRIERSRILEGDVGVEIVASERADARSVSVAGVRTGMLFRDVEMATVEDCSFRDVSGVGVSMVDSPRVRVARSSFQGCDVGVEASGAEDHTICDNTFADCVASGVLVRSSAGDVVARNDVRGGRLCIWLDRAVGPWVLRNTAAQAGAVGLLLEGVEKALVLDNQVVSAPSGLALVASHSIVVRRNEVRDAASEGYAFWNGSLGNTVASNRVLDSHVGILLAGSEREMLFDNSVAGCDVAVALHRIGQGVHVENHHIEACGAGIVWDDEGEIDSPLVDQGFRVEREASSSSPLVVGNLFLRVRALEVENRTPIALLATENQSLPGELRVAGHVILPTDSGETMAIAAGSSTTETLLGRLLQIALAERGVRVVDLIGLPDGEAARAVQRGDADAAWLVGSGTACNAFWPISVRRAWSLVVAAPVGAAGSVILAAPHGAPVASAAAALLAEGIVVSSVRDVSTSDEAESLLKFGDVDAALLDRIEETLTLVGYAEVPMEQGALPAIGLCVGPSAADPVGLRATFDRLLPVLHDDTLRQLAGRVRLLRREPLDVAMDFLIKAGLVGDLARGGES